MRRFLFVLLMLPLPGCVASQFHAVGPTQMSVYDANRACFQVAVAQHPMHDWALLGAAGGAAGGAVAGAVAAQDGSAARNDVYERCMLQAGYMPN